MAKLLTAILTALATCVPVQAATVTDSPDLPVKFFNAIPDICFQAARGHPPTAANADALLIEPATNVPATVKAHYHRITTWFELKSAPENVFIGVGENSNACHVVLANTNETAAVQKEVIGILKMSGFRLLQSSGPAAPITDMLFVKEAPDGFMLISLQGPRASVRAGDGDQGAVHVNLMSKAMFKALISKH